MTVAFLSKEHTQYIPLTDDTSVTAAEREDSRALDAVVVPVVHCEFNADKYIA